MAHDEALQRELLWRPSAQLRALRQRAALLRALRTCLDARGLLEVQTPSIGSHAVSDVHLHSFAVADELERQSMLASAARGVRASSTVDHAGLRYLQTSPEYAMKRLLAAGSGDIWQLAAVARAGAERSRLHNPEFTLLEWYRVGWSLERLIDEVAILCNAALAALDVAPRELVRLHYAEAFRRAIDLDPLECTDAALLDRARAAGLAASADDRPPSRDELLDFLMGNVIGPTLGAGTWCCVSHYPASQAALARLDREDPRVALRFELYAEGIELANGYDELADADEQCRRFEADNRRREALGLPLHEPDARLLAALRSGLPACSGVALGVDRLLMVATGAARIDDVLCFAWERA